MSNQPASRLAAIMRGDYQKMPVTPVTPVTGEAVTGSKSLKLRGLHGLQVKNSYVPKSIYQPVTSLVTDLSHVPPIYRHGMAELIAHCPDGVFWQYHQWAIADCATFFKSPFGQAAAEFADSNDCVGWTAEHLFTPPIDGKRGGLLWWLRGAEIEAMGGDWARNDGGEVFDLLANNLSRDKIR